VLSTEAQAVTLERSTFQTLVLLSAIPAFLAVIILARWAKDVPIKPRSEQGARPVRLTLGAMDRRFRYFLLIVGIFTLGNSADAFLVLRAQERGLSIAGILGMLLTFNVVYALLSGPAGALSDRIGRDRLIIFGWVTYAVLYVGFALAQTAAAVWVLYALYGVYYASVEGVAKALVADIVPSEQRGAAYGYYNAAIGLIALPSSLLAGVLWQIFGPSAPFLGGGALALTAVVLLALWHRKA
jgi:MFS family permease